MSAERGAASTSDPACGLTVDTLNLALEAAGVGVWSWDIASGRVTWSSSLAQAHGLPPGNCGGTFGGYVQTIVPDDRPAVLAAIDEALATGSPYQIEFRTVRPDGSLHWTRASGRPVLDEQGRVARMLGICSDVTQRREIDERLRDRERAFEALVENAPDVIARFGRDLRHLYVNPAVGAVFGVPARECLGRTNAEIGIPEDPETLARWQDAIRRVLDTGRDHWFETMAATPAGRRGYHARLTAERGPDGSVESVLAMVRDVTDLVRARQTAVESGERLRGILEAVADGITLFDARGAITYVNAAAQQIGGRAEGALCGIDVDGPRWSLLWPDGRPLPDEQHPIATVLRTCALAHGVELDTLRADGRRIGLSVNAVPLRDSAGALAGAVASYRDVTDQRRADRELRRHAQFLELAHDTVIVHDLDNHISFWNRGAEEMYGWSRDEAMGEVAWELLHTRFPLSFEEVRAALAGRGSWEGESSQLRRDGRRILVASRWALQRDERGEPAAILEINRDVTAQRAAEEELRRSRDHVEALNASLQRKMNETHHRVRNNLQVISALVDMLVIAEGDQVPKAELRRVARHIRSLAAIHDLLTRQARTDAEVEYLSVGEAMAKLKPLIQATASDRDVRFEVEDLRLPVRQGTALAVLVSELVANAIQHGAGDIMVAFGSAGEKARLEVTDSGSGFAEGSDPRSDGSTGLDLVRSFAASDLRGTVHAANRPDRRGARVTVEFPVPAVR